MILKDISGVWNIEVTHKVESNEKEISYCYIDGTLPGTLDSNRIGYKFEKKELWCDDICQELEYETNMEDAIKSRLTRVYSYEGIARYSKKIHIEREHDKRIFLYIERSRRLELEVDGVIVEPYIKGTVSTPYVYELTDFIQDSMKDEIQLDLICDNCYTGWPRESIVYSSAATDETQTNWNGIIGRMEVQCVSPNFIQSVKVKTRANLIDISIHFDCLEAYQGHYKIYSEAFKEDIIGDLNLTQGKHHIMIEGISLKNDIKTWDEYSGNLYELIICAESMDNYHMKYGIRDIISKDGLIYWNSRRVFLRSESNCCVFPETGYMPMTVEAWLDILKVYQSYGVNLLRFHSHCPGEAAFEAADRLGILIQVELSHWNPKNAFEEDISYQYYRLELEQILKYYGNHPSFLMLSFGNELQTSELGESRMGELLELARTLDGTKLYASGSNNYYGNQGVDIRNDFYTSSNYKEHMLRGISSPNVGHINGKYPSTVHNYDNTMDEIRKVYSGPVFSFEVGQFQVLPDFEEISQFHGVTLPNNYICVEEEVMKAGWMPTWKQWVEASGELSFICYKEEVEAVLRTQDMSGISLLGLQDFTGQGTALVGMIDSHMKSKPFDFAKAERFQGFFRNIHPMILMEKYCYTEYETLEGDIIVTNYSNEDCITSLSYKLTVEDGLSANPLIIKEERIQEVLVEKGKINQIKHIQIDLKSVPKNRKCKLSICYGIYENEYPIWIYQDYKEIHSNTRIGQVLITNNVEEMMKGLDEGDKVLYITDGSNISSSKSVDSQFSTDFWSLGTFSYQSGNMGLYIEKDHPIFENFPTEFHSNWQWWPMTSKKALILDNNSKPIVRMLDSYARLRNLGLLCEGNIGKGKLMICSMGLLEQQEYPEVRALLHSIVEYMNDDKFKPVNQWDLDELLEYFS